MASMGHQWIAVGDQGKEKCLICGLGRYPERLMGGKLTGGIAYHDPLVWPDGRERIVSDNMHYAEPVCIRSYVQFGLFSPQAVGS